MRSCFQSEHRPLRRGRTRWAWWWIRRTTFFTLCARTRARFLVIASSRTTGVLTAQNPPNLSTGSQPVALAIHSSGKFLYTSNSGPEQHFRLYLEYDQRINEQSVHGEQSAGAERDGGAGKPSGHRVIESSESLTRLLGSAITR